MSKKTKILETVEVLTPIWVLKAKVEQDWEDYMDVQQFPTLTLMFDGDDVSSDEEEEEFTTTFPEADSTIKCLEILEKYNIFFNTKTGVWESR